MAIDVEKLTKFKYTILITALLVVVVLALLVNNIVPKVQSISLAANERRGKESQLAESQRKLDSYKETAMQATDMDMTGLKEMYKPIESGLDSESVIASQFNDILIMLRDNYIKTKSIKYTYNPQDDAFVKGASDKLHVCQLDMQMVANYKDFGNFLKDLHKHEHFLDIAKVEILPYAKNKTILIINLKLKLYAQKV